MHKAQQRVAVGNLQHVITVPQRRIRSDQRESLLDSRPIFHVGLGIVEWIRFLKEVAGRTKTELCDDVVVVLRTVRPSRGGPRHAHILAFEIAVELFAEMHVTDQLGAGVSCGLIHGEDALGCHLRTRGVGAICRGKIELLQFVCGFVCVGDARFRQWRIRPALQPVISVEKRLPVSDKMKMKQHGFHATLTV